MKTLNFGPKGTTCKAEVKRDVVDKGIRVIKKKLSASYRDKKKHSLRVSQESVRAQHCKLKVQKCNLSMEKRIPGSSASQGPPSKLVSQESFHCIQLSKHSQTRQAIFQRALAIASAELVLSIIHMMMVLLAEDKSCENREASTQVAKESLRSSKEFLRGQCKKLLG